MKTDAMTTEAAPSPPEVAAPATSALPVRTFLLADVRGYARFTQEHGDAAAARLAQRFATLARELVEAQGGRVLELRGDEALCVFVDVPAAVAAALALQARCVEVVRLLTLTGPGGCGKTRLALLDARG